MEKIQIPENYQRNTRKLPPTKTKSEWSDLGYSPNPDCPVCKGAGFLHPRDGERIRYDRVVYCQEKGCLFERFMNGQPREMMNQSFESFNPVFGTENALKYSRQLAYGEKDFIWLLVYGGTGNGKSHLGNSIVKVVRDRGMEVRMILSADLFSRLKEAMEKKQMDSALRGFKELFFLVIDDYGVEYGSEWEQAKFDELMTARFAWAKPTVLITNKDMNDLPERILSRFKDSKMARIAHNKAPDYRGRK